MDTHLALPYLKTTINSIKLLFIIIFPKQETINSENRDIAFLYNNIEV